MKKKIILGILFVGGVVLGVVAGLLSNNEGSKQIELTYSSNGGSPYKWEYKIKDKDIVKFVKKYVISEEKKDGGEIRTNYVFKGLKKGKTTVTFKYVNIVDGSVEKEETINLKVDGRKNISLVANFKD